MLPLPTLRKSGLKEKFSINLITNKSKTNKSTNNYEEVQTERNMAIGAIVHFRFPFWKGTSGLGWYGGHIMVRRIANIV